MYVSIGCILIGLRNDVGRESVYRARPEAVPVLPPAMGAYCNDATQSVYVAYIAISDYMGNLRCTVMHTMIFPLDVPQSVSQRIHLMTISSH